MNMILYGNSGAMVDRSLEGIPPLEADKTALIPASFPPHHHRRQHHHHHTHTRTCTHAPMHIHKTSYIPLQRSHKQILTHHMTHSPIILQKIHSGEAQKALVAEALKFVCVDVSNIHQIDF